MVLINSTNNKYAIIIGINYKDTDIELNGCINDADNIKNFLLNRCNYKNNDIKLLT